MKNAFDELQYARTQLLLAEQRNDVAGIEKWRERVAYWQRRHDSQKRQVT